MKTFNSKILTVPGLNNSGPQHWQSVWEKDCNFERIMQQDWDTPECSDWTKEIDLAVERHNRDVILIGHSLACTAIASWALKYKKVIKGALLVAPSDTEAISYPPVTTGFTPMPLNKLPFSSIIVASTNDFYVSVERAKFFAEKWGSELRFIGDAGHINVETGFGAWPEGLELVKLLDLM
jgi:predicted alpha/beta hydrolase family esterase